MTTTTEIEKDIFTYTDQKLTAHFQNNEKFNQEMGILYAYYLDKLRNIIRIEDQEIIEKDLFESIKSQIFNGYYIGQELLTMPDNQFTDEVFTNQTEGLIAQQIPNLLRTATNENIEGIITTDPMKNLISWMVVEYEDIYNTLLDIALNSACVGTKWAFLDEAEKRGLTLFTSNHAGFLAPMDDITFINPQDYLVYQVSGSAQDSEAWEIISCNHDNYNKIGEVHIIRFLKEGQEQNYYMNINVKSHLPLAEQQALIDNLASRLMFMQSLKREQVVIKASSVEEYYLLD